MPISDERRRELARMHHETNDKAVARYIQEVGNGKSAEEAREIVKRAFSTPDMPYGDLRLDRALSSRAGAFSPGSIAELEAKALTYITNVDLDVQRIRRFYEGQLDEIAERRVAGEEWVNIELIEQVGGKFEGVKYRKMPLAEAERKILQALVETNREFWNAMSAMKVNTVINIRADNLSTHTPEELHKMLEDAKQKHNKGVAS